MGYSSKLYANEIIIHDSTPMDVAVSKNHSRGLDLSPRPREGYAYGDLAEPFPSSLLIPPSEWEARIKEMEERKTRLSDIILAADLPPHDQDGIPYCWIHGPTGAVEAVRLVQNQETVLLSATSAGAIIKNFRQEGGWGKEGLEFIVNRGVMPQSLWPENKLNRSYDTPANWETAAKYKCSEWWELKPRNMNEMMSCLFLRIPIAIGLNWWGHEVYACDPVWMDRAAAIRIRNSWGPGWGEKGLGILQGSRMMPDDAVAPRVMLAA